MGQHLSLAQDLGDLCERYRNLAALLEEQNHQLTRRASLWESRFRLAYLHVTDTTELDVFLAALDDMNARTGDGG